MRAFVAVGIAALVASAIVPRYAVQMLTPMATTAALESHAAETATRPNTDSSGSVVIAPSNDEHFRVTGRVDGRPVDFMVDTGASVIALTQHDAVMLGINPAERDYDAMVKTANGVLHVAPVELSVVEIDDLVVHNVAAVVTPPGVLSESLLGLSFLSRLRRFEYADGKLILEQ
jgi:aspartyl protease family protein